MKDRIEITEENKGLYQHLSDKSQKYSAGQLMHLVAIELKSLSRMPSTSPELKEAIKDIFNTPAGSLSILEESTNMAYAISTAQGTDTSMLNPKDDQPMRISDAEKAHLNVFARVLNDKVEKTEAQEARVDEIVSKTIEFLAKPFQRLAGLAHEARENAARIDGR